MRENNTSVTWPLAGFTASTIACTYRCILTFAFPFHLQPYKVFGVLAEILPVRELEPTREPDVEFRERA